MWTSTNGESIWSMARWRWRSSTAWSKERSSSRSKVRLTVPLWSKATTSWPERGSSQLLPDFCAHRRPERNPTPGSLSTAKLVPVFAATDTPRHVLLITFCCLTFYCDLANTGDGVQDFITLFGEPEEFLNQRVVHQRQPSVVASDSFVFVVIDGGFVGKEQAAP